MLSGPIRTDWTQKLHTNIEYKTSQLDRGSPVGCIQSVAKEFKWGQLKTNPVGSRVEGLDPGPRSLRGNSHSRRFDKGRKNILTISVFYSIHLHIQPLVQILCRCISQRFFLRTNEWKSRICFVNIRRWSSHYLSESPSGDSWQNQRWTQLRCWSRWSERLSKKEEWIILSCQLDCV